MTTKDLLPGDWISIDWIGYKLYVVSNDVRCLTVSSPQWGVNETMTFQHWRFNYREGKCWKFIGKSKTNPLYNTITKMTGFIHPVVLIKH